MPLFVSVGSLAIFSATLGVMPSLAGAQAAAPSPAAASVLAPANEPIGRVTAAFGEMHIDGPAGGKRGGDLQSLLYNEDVISTDGGGVTLLLATRVVLKIDAHSSVAISEGANQTNLLLERGTVQVFVGQRPANSGSVVLRDMCGRAETINGVFLASYDPATKSSYYACERSTVALSSVTGVGQAITLNADTQASIVNGLLGGALPTDRVAFAERKQSVDRLGQSAVRQTGSDTFRLRSRTLDMEVALSQLSAAGWIDRTALGQLTQQSGVLKASSSSSSAGKSTGLSQSQGLSTSAASSSANTASASSDSSEPGTGSGEPAAAASPVSSGSTSSSLTLSEPSSGSTSTGTTSTELASSESTSSGSASSGSGSSTPAVPTATANVTSASGGSPASPTVVENAADSTHLNSSSSTPSAASATFTVSLVATSAAPAASTVTVVPVTTATLTAPAAPAKIDIAQPSSVAAVPAIETAAVAKVEAAVPKIDVELKHAATPAISNVAIASIDNAGKGSIKADSASSAAMPAKADLGFSMASSTPHVASDAAIVLKKETAVAKDVSSVDLMPRADVTTIVPSKVDLPKTEVVVPKNDVVVPKTDVVIVPKADVIVPKVEVATQKDLVPSKADLGLSNPIVAIAPKVDTDLGNALKDVAKVDITPKIDVVPKADVVVPKADIVVPKADVIVIPKNDVVVPKADVVIPKADIVVVPKIDIAPPVALPAKADIGASALPTVIAAVPVVNIDVVPKAAVPTADISGLKDVLKDVKDVAKTADTTKLDVKPETKPDVIPAVKDIVKVELPTLDVKPTPALPTPTEAGVIPVVPTDTKIDKIDKSGKDDTVKAIVEDVVTKDVSAGGSKDAPVKPAK